jgi:nitroreductase
MNDLSDGEDWSRLNPCPELTPDELLVTTRTVRRRLDLERPVERAVVEECLRIGFQAPTGGNAQNWAWVVVDEVDLKREMAAIYRLALEEHRHHFPVAAPSASGYNTSRLAVGTHRLTENMERVPVLLVPAFAARYEGTSTFAQATLWGSILPAVWNFMIALRTRGLGSAWTTLHLHRESEMARLLGIPGEFTQAGLFPVAYTVGTSFQPGDRSFSNSRIFWNRCDLSS